MQVIKVARKKRKPGPKTILGGERLNFMPGEKLKANMDELIADAKRVAGEKLTYAYILREGAITQIRYIQDLLSKARKGQLGAKRREGALFPDLKE